MSRGNHPPGPYYPIYLDLRECEALVVGAGKVALRKVRGLMEAGARVTVVSPAAEPEFGELPVRMLRRRFRSSDVRGKDLVFAAANDRSVNEAVERAARAHGIWVNVADAPQSCSFHVPARVRRGWLQIAVSTGGRSPRIAKALRIRLESLLAEVEP